jgi:hypothetical protein
VVGQGAAAVRGVLVDDVDALRFLVEAGYASLLVTPHREASVAARTADFVALRIAGGSGWRVALEARDLIRAIGLSPVLEGGIASALDVIVPVGEVPAPAASALAALLAGLLAEMAEGHGVTVSPLEAPFAPYAVVVPLAAGAAGEERRATASLPLAWEELDGDVGGTSLDAVVARLGLRGGGDPWQVEATRLMGSAASFTDAVHALEQMVAGGGKRGSFVRDPTAR